MHLMRQAPRAPLALFFEQIYARSSLAFGLSPLYPHFLHREAFQGLWALHRMQIMVKKRRFSATSNLTTRPPPRFREYLRQLFDHIRCHEFVALFLEAQIPRSPAHEGPSHGSFERLYPLGQKSPHDPG